MPLNDCEKCSDEAAEFLESVSEAPIEWIKTYDIKTLNEIFNHKDEIYSAVMDKMIKSQIILRLN